MPKYKLGFQRIEDVHSSSDGTTKALIGDVISLPVGKIIGRTPKSSFDCSEHVQLGIPSAANKIPRRMFRIQQNTSEVLVLNVVVKDANHPKAVISIKNIKKLIKYYRKDDNTGKQHEYELHDDANDDGSTLEVVLRPDDKFKIEIPPENGEFTPYTFRVVQYCVGNESTSPSPPGANDPKLLTSTSNTPPDSDATMSLMSKSTTGGSTRTSSKKKAPIMNTNNSPIQVLSSSKSLSITKKQITPALEDTTNGNTNVRRSNRSRKQTVPLIAETSIAHATNNNTKDKQADSTTAAARKMKKAPPSFSSKQSSLSSSRATTVKTAKHLLQEKLTEIEESSHYKEQVLKIGDIVYAKYHTNGHYYWGKIESYETMARKGIRYFVRFYDDDTSPNVAAKELSRGICYIKLIQDGWWSDLPPDDYLQEMGLSQKEIIEAKKKIEEVKKKRNLEDQTEKVEGVLDHIAAPSRRSAKRSRAQTSVGEKEFAAAVAVQAGKVIKNNNKKKSPRNKFDIPTCNFVPPMDKDGNIILPPGVEPFVPTVTFCHMLPENDIANSVGRRLLDDDHTLMNPSRWSSMIDDDEQIDGDTAEDDDDEDEDGEENGGGPRNMHVSLAKVYWKALNSPQPHLGSQSFRMLLNQNRIPETRLCSDIIKLLTKGPELRNYPYYDGHRLHLTFEYVEQLVERFPNVMYPRFAEAAGSDYWKLSLDYLTTLPYGENDISSALSLHVSNLKLLDLLFRGLVGLDDENLPLIRDIYEYGPSAACRTFCQSMSIVWVKYGHYMWEPSQQGGMLLCPLAVDLTNLLSLIVVQVMEYFKISISDRIDMLWNAMDRQIQKSERKRDNAWKKELKLYWISSLLVGDEGRQDMQVWEDLCMKLARHAGAKEYIAMVGNP